MARFLATGAKDSVDVLVRRRLRELRMQRGLTLEDVAREARGQLDTRHGVTYWPLTRQGPAGGLHTFKIRVSARRRNVPTRPARA